MIGEKGFILRFTMPDRNIKRPMQTTVNNNGY